jgi:hypothetical protein
MEIVITPVQTLPPVSINPRIFTYATLAFTDIHPATAYLAWFSAHILR